MPYVFNPFTGSFDDTVPLSGGKVPVEYLPSYVDDVVEYASLAAFPATGETGKIYLALDASTIYRWSGSQYVLIGSNVSAINDLSDVDISTAAPSVGQALAWDGSNFVPTTVVRSTDSIAISATDLAVNASADFTITTGDIFVLLSISNSAPSWVRVYGSSAARAADTRTTPGEPYPESGSDFYAEVVTTSTPQTIKLAPVPVCQGTSNSAYVRVVNTGSSTASITSTFSILPLLS